MRVKGRENNAGDGLIHSAASMEPKYIDQTFAINTVQKDPIATMLTITNSGPGMKTKEHEPYI